MSIPKGGKRHVQQNSKTLLKDTKKWKGIACSWIRRINTVKIAIFP